MINLSPVGRSQDFRYEFSYRIGGGPQHTLYRGTDAQHYFSLPAGEPGDGYQGESPADLGAGDAHLRLQTFPLVSKN